MKCPKCNSMEAVRIEYGMPDESMLKAAEEGKIIIGGCEREAYSPIWRCKKCGADGEKD
ncbi:MAG: hypothetical protein AABX01_06310 [Candidatus Micrarchaeota archaeon]